MPPPAKSLNKAYQIFTEAGLETEYLVGYEGNAFASTGDIEEDLVKITSVHPLKEEAVAELKNNCNADWKQINKLIDEGKIEKVRYKDDWYYVKGYH